MSLRIVSNTVVLKKAVRALTIDELMSRYELSNRAAGKSEKTIGWYNEILILFSRYLKENRFADDLSSINTDMAKRYILFLRNKPKFKGHPFTPRQSVTLSPQTLRCHTRALKAFSTWLHVEEYTPENRLKNLKLPKATIRIIEPLTLAEIKQIIASIDKSLPTGVRNHTIFVLLLDTGLRASEVAGITIKYLNLQDGFIRVMGKGAKERVVPIGNHVQSILLNYINSVRPQPVDRECDKLFLSRNGKPITVNTLKLVFTRLAKHSGVERLHAHLCRHTFSINYLLNGGDIFSLRAILGHTTLEMVNHYLHFTSSQITAQHHKFSPMDKLQEQVPE